MNRDPEACHQFLELQAHVMSAACQMEKGIHSPHVYAESGDIFFLHLEKLGRGGTAWVIHVELFGDFANLWQIRSVDKVQSRVTKQIYARKKISRQRDLKKDKEIIKKFENELQILKKLDHVHLIKVFASYTDRRFVAIIMKPVASMDLSYYLQARGNSISGEERIRFKTYYGCLANAVAYLHENNIRHKDIKPGNILLKGEDIYITDFGTAVEFDGDKSVTTGTVKVKTHRYQSPEVSRGTKRGTASDIVSIIRGYIVLSYPATCEIST
jgi:serine/threonine protein kinase